MSGDAPSGPFDRPVLVVDSGFHTATISRSDVDATGRIAVTGSYDCTVRIWSLEDGALKLTIRLPLGPGDIGKVFAVALSPDGELVAASSRSLSAEEDPQAQIYIFSAISGMLRHRVVGLASTVTDLAFSRDGNRLAAALAAPSGGFRLYAGDGAGGWTELAVHSNLFNASYGVAFAADGRLAATSWDGWLRLYDPDGDLIGSVVTPHDQPFGVAFNPADNRLAVGFQGAAEVALYDGATLEALPAPDLDAIDDGDLSEVAWSSDGATLFAAGRYQGAGGTIVAWSCGGPGSRRLLPAGDGTVMSLRPLPDGALLAASADPWLGVHGPDGAPRWARASKQVDHRFQANFLVISSDAMVVEFEAEHRGERSLLRFDVATLRLLPSSHADLNGSVAPDLDGVPLAITPLELSPEEVVHSASISFDRTRFVFGTEWTLHATDEFCTELWRRPMPEVVWAVNISRDGRVAVAACGDGTIRWHRMEDGVELIALFPLPDGENWVAWTPEGIHAATPGARGILRWHVNRGWDRAAEAIPVSEIPETNRPEVIRHVLPQMGTPGALAVTEMAKIRGAVRRAIGSDVAPGARLHVLAIGVSDYGDAARHLDLAYADHDARDVAAALRRSQDGLYAEVRATVLVNAEATKTRIFEELEEVRKGMEAGDGSDLAVIQFSGHGDMVDGGFYLLPHGIDDGSSAAVKAHGLPATQFHDEIAAIAAHGRVLLLIDACRSGGVTAPPDRSLRAMMRSANVTVLTSCAEKQLSREDMAWENGAFTEALLEALGGADYDHDGLIGIGDLCRYLGERVPAMTDGAQRPEVETRGSDIRILARL